MKNKHNWINHLLNFIAVILGVYLAFLINEKATLNKEQKESEVLMRSLVVDLSEDVKTYEDYQIPVNILQQDKIKYLLELLANGDLDDIGQELSSVFQVENFAPTTSTYNSIKAANNLRLIDDLGLQKKLSDYYEGMAVETTKKGDFQVDYFSSELLPWLTDNVDLSEMKLLKGGNLMAFRNRLVVYESLIDQKVGSYQMAVTNSKQLKMIIEMKLESE